MGVDHPRERAATPGSDALRDAWAALDAARPDGWCLGRPSYHPERREWIMHVSDPTEEARDGLRSREWTAVHPTRLGVIREMARCLRILGRGELVR